MRGLLFAELLTDRRGTGIWAALCMLLLWKVSNMERLDVSNYAIPEAYALEVYMICIICAIMFGLLMRLWLHERAADNKVAEGKIENTNCLPYDKRYELGTVAGMVVGAAMGIAFAPFLVEMFLVNAGGIWYCLSGGAIAAVSTVFWVMAFHCGLRLAIVRAKDYIFDINQVLKEAKDEVEAQQAEEGDHKGE